MSKHRNIIEIFNTRIPATGRKSFRWRLKSKNGAKLSTPGESFNTMNGCVGNINSVYNDNVIWPVLYNGQQFNKGIKRADVGAPSVRVRDSANPTDADNPMHTGILNHG